MKTQNQHTQNPESANLAPAPQLPRLSTSAIRSDIVTASKSYPLATIRAAGLLLEVYAARHVKQIATISRELTIGTAVNGGLQFSKIKREIAEGNISEREAVEALGALFDLTFRQFNLPRAMEGDQIAFLCLDVLSRYPFLKFEELVYICREAITGKYNQGKDGFFGGISAFHVHGWINQYLETERNAAIVAEAEREHEKLKTDENPKEAQERAQIWQEYERIAAVGNGLACNVSDRKKHIAAQGLNLKDAKSLILRPEERPEYLNLLRQKCAAPELYSDDRLKSWLPFYERENLTAALEIVSAALAERLKNNPKCPKK